MVGGALPPVGNIAMVTVILYFPSGAPSLPPVRILYSPSASMVPPDASAWAPGSTGINVTWPDVSGWLSRVTLPLTGARTTDLPQPAPSAVQRRTPMQTGRGPTDRFLQHPLYTIVIRPRNHFTV